MINWIWILVLFLTPLPELTSNGFDPQNLVVSETSHVFCSRVSGLLKHRVLEGSGLWPQLNCEMKWSLELDTHVLMAVQQCQGPIGPHAHKFQEKDRIHTLTWSGWLRNVLGYSRTHFCFSKTRQHWGHWGDRPVVSLSRPHIPLGYLVIRLTLYTITCTLSTRDIRLTWHTLSTRENRLKLWYTLYPRFTKLYISN